MKWKIAAMAFVFCFMALVVMADTGRMPRALHAVYDFPGGDKVGHVAIYGALAFFLAAAFPRPSRIGGASVPVSMLALAVVTVVEESSQSLVSTRTFDLADLACSLAGVIAGAFFAARMVRNHPLKAD